MYTHARTHARTHTQPQEKEVFNFDASKLDWEDYLMRYAYGLRTYALNEKGLFHSPLLRTPGERISRENCSL
jgi:hypothetical protein